jgi:long-subunit acyl-CoA synthetase (AMP-forming)
LGKHYAEQDLAINYRLKPDDIAYIFDHAGVDAILVDAEYEHLLDGFKKDHPNVPLLVDTDTDPKQGSPAGPYEQAVLEGLEYDKANGGKGWDELEMQAPDEEAVIALAYTSGTTAKPKGVEYTHRGAYMGAMGNVIESGLNYNKGRCRYLWTLPMFHAMGMPKSLYLKHLCSQVV